MYAIFSIKKTNKKTNKSYLALAIDDEQFQKGPTKTLTHTEGKEICIGPLFIFLVNLTCHAHPVAIQGLETSSPTIRMHIINLNIYNNIKWGSPKFIFDRHLK